MDNARIRVQPLRGSLPRFHGVLPETIVDSGNQWGSGWGEDSVAEAQQMVDHALTPAHSRDGFLLVAGRRPACFLRARQNLDR